MLVEAKMVDYVLVNADYAIEVLNRKEAEETLQFWKQILESE